MVDDEFGQLFGAQLRRERDRRRLSQRESTRYSGSLVAQIESSQPKPSVSTPDAIASGSRITVDNILRFVKGADVHGAERLDAEDVWHESREPLATSGKRRTIELETELRPEIEGRSARP